MTSIDLHKFAFVMCPVFYFEATSWRRQLDGYLNLYKGLRSPAEGECIVYSHPRIVVTQSSGLEDWVTLEAKLTRSALAHLISTVGQRTSIARKRSKSIFFLILFCVVIYE